jgi:hypothetical protein
VCWTVEWIGRFAFAAEIAWDSLMAPLLDRLDMEFRVGMVTWSTGRAMQHLRLFC